MILSTHAVVGGAIAVISASSPEAAFALGFASHYMLDAFPHWDYFDKLESLKDLHSGNKKVEYNASFFRDFVFIAFDCLLGFFLVLLFAGFVSQNLMIPAFFGALGGVFPDALQFIYFNFRTKSLEFIQRGHEFIHTSDRLENFPKSLYPQLLIMLGSLILIFI